MDAERPHFRTATASAGGGCGGGGGSSGELFICFPSRLSSSSSTMKLSKSILSPGRPGREGSGPAVLTPSLSRRLRSNGSMKGGQASPFFTATGKKRGCAFENPEPSSPKVTCIGQVRVKTKKKGKKQVRSLSRRRSGEVSFRKVDQGVNVDDGAPPQQRYSTVGVGCAQPAECPPHRNQRWVHLPVSICEALRGFGEDFSCLLPCRAPCFSTSARDRAEKQAGSNGSDGGCGSVFARWWVSVNDGEGGGRREIELVVGGGEEPETLSVRSSRRHVFENFEVKDNNVEVRGKHGDEDEAAATVSICIPPKNALLLMRCRSDPMKMASLMNRFKLDAPRYENEDIREEEEEEEPDNKVGSGSDSGEQEVAMQCDCGNEVEEEEEATVSVGVQDGEEEEAEAHLDMKLEENNDMEAVVQEEFAELDTGLEARIEEGVLEELARGGRKEEDDELQEEVERSEELFVEEEDETKFISTLEALLEQNPEEERFEDCAIEEDEEPSPAAEEEIYRDEGAAELQDEMEEPEPEEATGELKSSEEEEEDALQQAETAETEMNVVEDGGEEEEEEECLPIDSDAGVPENQDFADEKEVTMTSPPRLPECLLLMMCEPKLSMEISKETWVCSTDFIRWLPERPRRQPKASKDGVVCCHEPSKRRLSADSKLNKPPPLPEKNKDSNQRPPHQQPARSSCSLPAAVAAASVATMIEQKLVNGVGYEPFVLTRCKSEPMRTAAAKLMPEMCFWKNAARKMEPHSQAAIGISAAGV